MNNNQFNVGDMIKATSIRGREITHAIVSYVGHSALMYKVIYLHDGVEGTLTFKYAHKFYDVVSESQ